MQVIPAVPCDPVSRRSRLVPNMSAGWALLSRCMCPPPHPGVVQPRSHRFAADSGGSSPLGLAFLIGRQKKRHGGGLEAQRPG